MKQDKVGICGHFANGIEMYNGQTVKTRILSDELQRIKGNNNILHVDTCNWKNKPLKLIFNILKMFSKCKNVIVMPADQGIKVFIPLFAILKKVFRRRIHYVVIGGWLPEFVQQRQWLIKYLKCFTGIYVETELMKQKLESLQLHNIIVMPNFKRLQIADLKEKTNNCDKYRICTFSRVMKEKGIEDAIIAVKTINEKLGGVFTLDIYGQVEDKYKSRFEELIKKSPEYIKYCGVVPYGNSTSVLKDYFVLLFPTHYEGEGFPGTIIDAYAAALPVIASDWRYNSEVMKDHYTGILFDDTEELVSILEEIYKKSEIIENMRGNCVEEARKYLPETIVEDFVKCLEEK